MSYSNGIGDLKQILTSFASTETSAVRQTERTGKPSGGTTSTSGIGADQASLSPASTLIANALAGPDVRLDKVAALKQSIENGSYNIPSSDVAGRMIDKLTEQA